MRIPQTSLVLMATLALGALALAHGGHDHVLGTVTAVDQTKIEVKTTAGKSVTLTLTPETKYFKEKVAAKAEDVKPGLRVVIDAVPKDSALEAVEVRIGVASGAASQPKP